MASKRKRATLAPQLGAKKRRAASEAASSRNTPRRTLIAGCQVVSPEEVGLIQEPLDLLRATVDLEVNKLGSCSGVAHLIIKDGKCAFAHAAGMADIERGRRFGLQTICALHSCSKPLTVAAFLTLVDEQKVRLSDPVEKYTRFSDRVALPSGSTRKVKAPATLRHLVTQVAGLRHSDEPEYKHIMARLKDHEITNLEGFCDALSDVPLQSEPGALHYYSLCIDILGRVCEVVSGQSLDKFMAERLFEPLGMKDTYFNVPRSKQVRKAVIYDCKRAERPGARTPFQAQRWESDQMHSKVFSGGGGMLSYSDAGIYGTAEDYARFCQMLLSGGVAADGRRVLRSSTVSMIWRDGLAPFAQADGRVKGWNDFGGKEFRFYWDHHAWSVLNATLDIDQESPRATGPARRGNTLWMYGMGAYWFIDAARKVVAVSMAQCFSDRQEDRGSDCVPFLRLALLGAKGGSRQRKPFYYGKEP
jgi:CubicO group peptidase (beta-lactamase class C family)